MSVRLASVVLPVYNQADHIADALQEYMAALARLDFPYELLVVVNGRRTDRSLDICRELESRHPQIRTIVLERGGWGAAVRAGLAEARGDLLCYTNTARTAGSDLLLMLLYGSIHPEAVIKANRKIRENWKRRLGSLAYNLECRALFDLPYWDINGTPKVFSRRLTPLTQLKRDDDLIDLEFNVICKRERYPMIEVPILSATRRSGKSTTRVGSAIRMFRGALALKREMEGRRSS
jgi:glycosyltransferase involved in cell wall biosynthesis